MVGSQMRRRILLCCLTVLFVASPTIASEGGEEVTIYRDEWGVPHIYGESARAASFGHGYAQAEDRLEDLLAAHLMARGLASSLIGKSAIKLDLVARSARHEQLAAEHYDELAGETRSLIEAYVAGINAYIDKHPTRFPAWAERPHPHHVVALFRAFAWAWPWGQAMGDLEAKGSHVSDGRGSNQWVVSSTRSADGSMLAMIDPHLKWQPQNRLYESHVHGGELNFFGFSIIGTPWMAMGHTDRFSLALTTGGPDCADVYEERLHPDDPLRYEYDGQWLPIEVERIEIPVQVKGERVDREFTLERTHHGPIVERGEGVAYAARTAYDSQIGLIEQWLRMILSEDLGQFLDALSMSQSLPQNLMYADIDGNSYYLRAGRVPRRPSGYDWGRPVPGWTSDTEWEGVHPLSDLVQALNPAGGYMQNCNVSPATMFRGSTMRQQRYPSTVYNIRDDRSNARGRRITELIEAQPAISVEDARRFAVDTKVESIESWQLALRTALSNLPNEGTPLTEPAEMILAWDGEIEIGSRAATLFRFWMRACRADDSGVTPHAVIKRRELDAEEQRALLRALQLAREKLTDAYPGDIPRWGEIHRHRAGDRDWPIAGCRADGISTLRSVRYSRPNKDGISHANGGQICPTLVVLGDEAIESFSAVPHGQSSATNSAHHADQAERLFVPAVLKPTWYGYRALEPHIQSRTLLHYRP